MRNVFVRFKKRQKRSKKGNNKRKHKIRRNKFISNHNINALNSSVKMFKKSDCQAGLNALFRRDLIHRVEKPES